MVVLCVHSQLRCKFNSARTSANSMQAVFVQIIRPFLMQFLMQFLMHTKNAISNVLVLVRCHSTLTVGILVGRRRMYVFCVTMSCVHRGVSLLCGVR